MVRRPQYGKHAAKPPAPRRAERERDRWPLAPEHLAPRTLELPEGPLPEVVVKSPTRQTAIFRKRIADVSQHARHGDIVRAVLPSGETLGYGMFNPRAEAMLKMLTWDDQLPDGAWWRRQLDQAVQLRTDLRVSQQSNACRLVHAESDGLPGVVIDLFDDVLSLEAFSLSMFQRGEALVEELLKRTGAKHWFVRPGPHTEQTEGYAHPGFTSAKAPPRRVIQEHGVKYEVDFATGHKTGFFCDQRENRLRLRDFCADKSVLDLCCYTGGFALNAVQAGAKEVTAVDLDEQAIETAKRNAKLNNARLRFVYADAFAYMRDMQRNGKTFDVVILDPPKLVNGRDDLDEGQRKYYDFNRLAASLVARDGMLITCSCSGLLPSEDFLKTVTAAVPFARQPRLLARTGAAMDHPVALNTPETEYLKCAWLRL